MPGAPRVHEDMPSNVCAHYTQRVGDVERAFAQAAHRFRERLVLDSHDGDRLVAPHDVAVDGEGRIFVAEVAKAWLRFNFDHKPDEEPVSVRRWDPVR